MVYQGIQQGPFWMLLLVCCTVGLNVFDSCENDKMSCPTGSHCKWLGCDGMRCICKNNLLPSVNKSSCVKETPLGEKCQMGTVCGGPPLSECHLGTCLCLAGYEPSKNGKECILVMKGEDTSAEHGEYCDNEKFWCFPDDLQCTNNKCVCEEGFRPATTEERYAEPYNTRFCRPKTFQLGVPVNVTGTECQKHDLSTSTSTSTTPSTTSTTTTTTTTTTPSTTSTTTTTTTPSTTSTTTTPSTTSTTTTPSTTSTSTTPSTTSTTTTPSTTSTTTTPSTTSTTTTSSTTSTTTTPSTTSTTTTPSTTSTTTTPSTTSTTKTPSTTSTTTTPSTTSTTTTPGTTSTTTTATPSTTSTTTQPITISTSTTTTSPSTTSTTTQPSTNSTANTTSSTTSTTTTPLTLSTGTSNSSSTTNTTVGVGQKCHHRKCQENSECVMDACKVERCRCELGYANSPDGKSCWKLSALGEVCGGERICQGLKTQCGDKGVCDCEDGYERSDSGRWCRLKTSWFIDFPVVGEVCSGGFFSECYNQFEQQCVAGRCRCKEGFKEIVEKKDMDAVYPDIVQCRNETFTKGKREEMFCLHQSRETHEYSMYDRAKSKIRKIQGAIIGGCVGFVAMLGIVIGVVALVRWKRKGRRETIRDTSSTASTDATSRYSFKIPRPFTHFVGSKEYDSTQIAYPNPVFDKEEERARSEPTPDVVNVGTLARDNQNILQDS